MSDWFQIGAADAFGDDAPTPVHAGGQQIAVFRLGEELFALKDLCTHGNARLSDGYVEDGCVECPLHQGLFDIRSGAPRSAPITEAVRCFPIRVVAGQVEVEVGTTAAAPAGGCDTCGQPVTVAATVTAITRPADDVAIITLQHDAAMPYRAGQYLDVLLEDGRRRSYSMAAPAADGKIELHVRHLPGGLFTDRLFGTPARLQAGDALMVQGPAGSFWLREDQAPVILLASGTGFAPLKAIIEQVIADGGQATRPMRLYWGGRTQRDLYQDSLCREWARRLPWLQYEPILSAPAPGDGWQGRTGLVHEAVMQDFPDLSRHQVYACGAPAMVAAAQRDFTERCGLAPAAFLADAFLSAADR